MILTLLLASAALLPSPQEAAAPPASPLPPIEDYVPGGPAHVHADARAWLARAGHWLDARPLAEARWRVTDEAGVTTEDRYWLVQGRLVAPQARVQANDSSFETGDDSAVGLDLEILAHKNAQYAWQRPSLGGHPALVTWLGCSAAPEMAALRLDVEPPAGVAARLHWIRDGLRGHLDLADDGAPLGWSWQADGCWGREGRREVEVLDWQARVAAEFPKSLQSILEKEHLIFEVASVYQATSAPYARLPAPEVAHMLLARFSEERAVRLDGELTIQLGADDETAIEVGRVALQGRLSWPALGSLTMRGEMGPPQQRKQVDSEVIGNGARLWHWDHRTDTLRAMDGLPDLLAGFQGLLPLYAWAARRVPEAGWQASWLGPAEGLKRDKRWLRLVDGPTTTDLLLDGRSVSEARVRATGAEADAPLMHYRFKFLYPNDPQGFVGFEESRERIEARLALEEHRAEETRDPRLDQLLPIGERAPLDAPLGKFWAPDEANTLQALLGKPVVLCFWYPDVHGGLAAVETLHYLRRTLDRTGEHLHWRTVAVDADLNDAASYLRDRSLDLPLLTASEEETRPFRARWLPTTYLIGQDGVVLGAWLGKPGPELRRLLERLLR